MHRIYTCTWFTCFTHTAKMALFTGLEHNANTNTLAIGPGRIKGGGGGGLGSNLSQVFELKKVLKRSITNAFPCVGLFASNLVLRQLKVLNL